VGPVQGKVTE